MYIRTHAHTNFLEDTVADKINIPQHNSLGYILHTRSHNTHHKHRHIPEITSSTANTSNLYRRET